MHNYKVKTNILDVIRNKAERAAATFVVNKNERYYSLHGDKIREGHLNLMLPIEIKQTKTVIN